MEQLTQEQAVRLAESGWWKTKSAAEAALFQLQQDRLSMPFDEFHRVVEEALGRGVWTHEFALNRTGLVAEAGGRAKAPSTREILDLLPRGKAIVAVVG